MNYLKLYCKLVRKFEERGLTKEEAKKQGLYTESHHIFPACIFGRNASNSRLIEVRTREHYIIHAVLEKAFVQRYGTSHWKTLKMTRAHILMSTDKNNPGKKYNSRLYEAARLRYSLNCVGENNPSTMPVRIYFEDGRILEHNGGKMAFCLENPEYSYNCLGSIQSGKLSKHKDIIKVELIDLELQKKRQEQWKERIKKITFNIRIYFFDGRIVCYDKGFDKFCEENPQYSRTCLVNLCSGRGKYHRDIIKVEKYDPENPGKPEPIVLKHWGQCIPVRIYFSNGTYIDWYKGLNQFAKENPKYSAGMLILVKNKKAISHKDILKIEEIDPNNPPEFIPIFLEDVIQSIKVKPIRIVFKNGEEIIWYESKQKFCEKYPEYNVRKIRRMQEGKKKIHKDIILVEEYNPQKLPTKIIFDDILLVEEPDIRINNPIRIHFADGKTVDWYESKSKFCKKYPQYNDECIRRVEKGQRKRHKDIIKVETINTPTTS